MQMEMEIITLHDEIPDISIRYIFNATFDAKAECDSGTPNVERYNTFCAEVVRNFYLVT